MVFYGDDWRRTDWCFTRFFFLPPTTILPTILSLTVALSPLHRVELAEGCAPLLDDPPEKDFSLHTVALKRAPDGRPLVHSELVIAGRQTRTAFPAANQFPVHFLKSYHPWSLHGDPGVEFARTCRAADILGAPPPIGHDANSFRTTFIPGRPLSRLLPFYGVEPEARALGLARELGLATLAGLWRLLEEALLALDRLHADGLVHGDAELHNVVVCPAPLGVFWIDYEAASLRRETDPEEWPVRERRDRREILRAAAIVGAALGRQDGALAATCVEALNELFRDSAPFRAALAETGGLPKVG